MALCDLFDGFLIDLDGVVYVGDEPLPGAADAITELQHNGKHVRFLTNDPVSPRGHYVAQLRSMGITTQDDDVVTAGWATARFIEERAEAPSMRVFVVGSVALKHEVASVGAVVVDDSATDADIVVVGGHRGFDYAELLAASRFVRQGADLVATGRDATFPMPGGPWPATGSVLAAVEVASGVTAEVVGKPERHMFSSACASLSVPKTRIVVVGDTPGSDIEGGRRAGLATVLVTDDPAPRDSIAADFIIPALTDLLV